MEIKVESIENNNNFKSDYLKVRLKGNDVNHVYVNTLRRVLLEEIPSYGINPDLINISKNSSVYNNDYLRNRIENFPLIDLNFKLDLEEYNKLRTYTRGIEKFNNDYEENNINMYLDVKNKEDKILNVTTSDVKYYLNDKIDKNIYKKDLLICKLKKNEEINLSIKVDKGVGLNHSRYSVAHVYYEQLGDNNFLLTIESRGQLSIKEILFRGLEILKYKLSLISEKFSNEEIDEDNGIIVLKNEDHTIGNLLTYRLQENSSINFAGYNLEHLLIKDVRIRFSVKDNKKINDILKTEIKYLINYYDNMQKKFSDIILIK